MNSIMGKTKKAGLNEEENFKYLEYIYTDVKQQQPQDPTTELSSR